jgi:hypothetical protein
MSTIAAPTEWIIAVSVLQLPDRADQRLSKLMDLNNNGLLTEDNRQELETFVELSETLSLIRCEALRLLQSVDNEGHA